MAIDRLLGALLGATGMAELSGGHQSRAFRVTRPTGDPIVAKVVDVRAVDRDELLARAEVVATLAELDPRVCRPLPIDGHLVAPLVEPDGRRHWVTCSEEATGLPPDPSDPHDAHSVGQGLAELHGTMRRVPPTSLSAVAALRAVPEDPAATGAHQLLHGDFRSDNLRLDGARLRIFDLDDCGYGPAALDVALSLYVVLFDATVGASPALYRRFREPFVTGYEEGAAHPLDPDELDHLIDLRVAALAVWLDDLRGAPVGIRTSPPSWHATLRSFVTDHRAGCV